MSSPPPVPRAFPEETLFAYASRFIVLLKKREDELATYMGDGLSSAQADEVLQKIRPIYEGSEAAPATVVWNAFCASVQTETSWLFAEKDPLAPPLIWASQQIQESLGPLLESAGLATHEELNRYVSLALIAQAASRQAKLKGNKVNWRLVLARLLYWLGGAKRKTD